MKKYYILLLLVCLLYSYSVIYKHKATPILDHFAIEELSPINEDIQIILVLFFSIKNCDPCLKIIETLNTLDRPFWVIGLVPDEELGLMERIRQETHAQFEIRGRKKFRRFRPNYYPTLYAISRRGKIFLVLPGVPGENQYLKDLLESFARRANELLIR